MELMDPLSSIINNVMAVDGSEEFVSGFFAVFFIVFFGGLTGGLTLINWTVSSLI